MIVPQAPFWGTLVCHYLNLTLICRAILFTDNFEMKKLSQMVSKPLKEKSLDIFFALLIFIHLPRKCLSVQL